MTLLVKTFNRAFVAAATPDAVRLRAGLANPRRAQLAILRKLVKTNADSAFGRAHGFASIRSYSDFIARVPITDYDQTRDEIDRIRRGHRGILTAEPVAFLEPTGGSTGPSKLIPYTASLKRQISRAANPWIRDLLSHRRQLRNGRSYWAVSPPGRPLQDATSSLPVGAAHDLDYLPRPVAALLERVLALPRAASEVDELDAMRYTTLRALLAADDLAFISVWNPSFLTLLMQRLDADFEMLLSDLEKGTVSIPLDKSLRSRLERALPARPDAAARLRRRFGSEPPANLEDVWRSLKTISCWTDGHAGRAVASMRRRFPTVEVQGKGLLATEGVVSLPLSNHEAPVAAVTSHFLEFVPEGGGAARLVDELEEDGSYEIVLTTGGGLYRYRLKDIVQVQGHVGQIPMIRLVGRADAASDLSGEKLTPAFVERVLTSAARASGVTPSFALLSARWGDPPSYDMWVELDEDGPGAPAAARLAAAAETELRRGHHYDLCRSLGQLGPLRVRLVRDAEGAYERVCIRQGRRAGIVKPPALVADVEWSNLFEEAID